MDEPVMEIEVLCEKCNQRNEMAERLINTLETQLKTKQIQYETFKDVAKLEFQKQRSKTFLSWLFGR